MTGTPSSTDDRAPEPGDVIEFSFLWSHEQAQGLVEGVKDRRCVVIRVLPGPRIVVLPITGTEPDHDAKIPLAPGAFGLTRRSWIVTSELNVSDWPGYDLRPVKSPPGPRGAFWRYGRLSDALRAKVAAAVAGRIKAGGARMTTRRG
jgi:hypothetical protein